MLAALALAFDHPLVLGCLLAVVLAAGALARCGGALLRALSWALPFALVIALVNPLVARQGLTVIARAGELPWNLGRLDITLEATAYGGILGLRALVVLLAGALLSATVDPDALLRGFRRVSFRSAVTTALATRLIPVLTRDARRRLDAQRVRAGEPVGRVAVLRAVTAGALDRSVDVAATLELRGYGLPGRAAGGAAAPWSRHDLGFAASAVLLAALAAAAQIGGVASFASYPRLVSELGSAEVVLCVALALVALAPGLDRRGVGP